MDDQEPDYEINQHFDMNDDNYQNTNDIDNVDLNELGHHLENQEVNVDYYMQQ